jgi:recombination protein RecA
MSPDTNQQKAIDLAVASIEKQFGKGAIMRLGSDTVIPGVETISTGSPGLDIALGIGGVLVIDSVAALVPQAEIEGQMGDAHMGLQARLMSQALRKLTGTISRSRTTVVFINQIRMKIGVMFGNPETTTGGNALKFYSSVRMDIRRIGAIKEGPEIIGNRTRVKVVKNKMAPPFKQAEFDIIYGEGISRAGDILDLASEMNLVEKSGAWYSCRGERIGQGRENAKAFLKEHPELLLDLEEKIYQHHGIKRPTRVEKKEVAEAAPATEKSPRSRTK